MVSSIFFNWWFCQSLTLNFLLWIFQINSRYSQLGDFFFVWCFSKSKNEVNLLSHFEILRELKFFVSPLQTQAARCCEMSSMWVSGVSKDIFPIWCYNGNFLAVFLMVFPTLRDLILISFPLPLFFVSVREYADIRINIYMFNYTYPYMCTVSTHGVKIT